MLATGKKLQNILNQILTALHTDNFDILDELIKKHQKIMSKLKRLTVTNNDAIEFAKILESSIQLEQAIIFIATDKKQQIIDQMNKTRKNRKAILSYNTQYIKGV